MLRWGLIKRDGLLRSNISKSFKWFHGCSEGYVYLTLDLRDALYNGLNKSLDDMLDLDEGDDDGRLKTLASNPNYRDVVIIGMNAFKLGDRVEIDPEAEILQKSENLHWYRCKGDIKLKHLYLYRCYPFNTFSNVIIDKAMKGITEKREMYSTMRRVYSTE